MDGFPDFRYRRGVFCFLVFLALILPAIILETFSHCPAPLRLIFSHLSEEVAKKYPENENLRYTAVSGYLFLRFFAAAILGPKLFGLTAEHPSQKNSRGLTLISKTVQQLANLLVFEEKEPYMGIALNDFMAKNRENMKAFLKKVATPPDPKDAKKKDYLLDKVGFFVPFPCCVRGSNPNLFAQFKKAPKGVGPTKIGGNADDRAIDIRLELASSHRLFDRSRAPLQEIYQQTNQECVKKVSVVLFTFL